MGDKSAQVVIRFALQSMFIVDGPDLARDADMKLRSAAATLAILLLSTTARAAPPPQEPSNRWGWSGVETQLSYVGPLGLAGLAFNVTPHPVLTLNAGLGWMPTGLAWGGGARLRAPVPADWAVAPSLGFGFSGRPHSYPGLLTDDEETGSKKWTMGLFMNSDLGIELRSSGGLSFRVFMGTSLLLNTGSYSCRSSYGNTSACQGSGGEGFQPYGGISLGYAIGP